MANKLNWTKIFEDVNYVAILDMTRHWSNNIQERKSTKEDINNMKNNNNTAKNAVLKLSFSRSGWVEPNQATQRAH